MLTILVTGGAGFIGSNFIRYMLDKYEDYRIINLDALTYAGNLQNLKDVSGDPRYGFVKGNIRDKRVVEGIFSKYDVDVVVNFAAESHVDRSIEEPEVFLTTNVIGTQILLEAAKGHWKIAPDDKYSREYKKGVKFVQISTDEVYGSLKPEDPPFTEESLLKPNSPYSASKASADLLVRAYYKTFGLPANITRCSNNYGPYQHPEKLIPLMITNCLKGKELPVYGDGMHVRDWLYVHDHCSAIDLVIHNGKSGEVYNIGGNNEKTNLEIVKFIIHFLGKSERLIRFVKDRPGHDRRYAIDSRKIKMELVWNPAHTFEEGIEETIRWYLNNSEWIEAVTSGNYAKYYETMYSKSLDQ